MEKIANISEMDQKITKGTSLKKKQLHAGQKPVWYEGWEWITMRSFSHIDFGRNKFLVGGEQN